MPASTRRWLAQRVASLPENCIDPPLTSRIPASISINVVLPAPFPPTSAVIDPSFTVSEMP
jgi:hypothetical protein